MWLKAIQQICGNLNFIYFYSMIKRGEWNIFSPLFLTKKYKAKYFLYLNASNANIISKKRIFANSNLYVCLRKSSEYIIIEKGCRTKQSNQNCIRFRHPFMWQGRREFLKELFYAQNGKNIAKNAEKQAKNRKLCPIKNEISKFFRFFSGNL